jgi:hypothetical protein
MTPDAHPPEGRMRTRAASLIVWLLKQRPSEPPQSGGKGDEEELEGPPLLQDPP